MVEESPEGEVDGAADDPGAPRRPPRPALDRPSARCSSAARSRDRSSTAARSRRSRPTIRTCRATRSGSCARSSSGRAAAASRRGRLPLPAPADPRRGLRRAAEGDARRAPRALRRLARGARPDLVELRRDRRLPPRAGGAVPRRARLSLSGSARGRQPCSGASRGAGARGDTNAAVTLLERASALLAADDPRRLALLPTLGLALYLLGRLDDCYGRSTRRSSGRTRHLGARVLREDVVARSRRVDLPLRDRARRTRRAGQGRGFRERRDAGGRLQPLGWALYWSGRLGGVRAGPAGDRACALGR